MMEPKVVVLGSCMIDFSSYAPRLPMPGETLHGYKFIKGYGGKGANQCVAATKLGSATSFIARVGDDIFGEGYISHLKELGVGSTHLKKTPHISSGIAQILVADSGENQIVIVGGANTLLSEDDVYEASQLIKSAPVLVCQFEVPLNTTIKAVQMKRKEGKGISIVNGAPAISNLDPALLESTDIFCVNEPEAELLTGIQVDSIDAAGRAVKNLLKQGCQTAIVTVGSEGAVFSSKGDPSVIHVPTRKVQPLDTTGAGDAFIGALAFYIANHPMLSLEEAIRRSCEIATISVMKTGTQTSFPERHNLPDDLFR
ncbi:hypothetical protein J437_LFUL014002 [Ladona fulva]|uniref:Ribokinase n=1 Tax=Ladona fulva TaxID=123851 RepID=A0A8K0P728_LADFU|nr:hypothetical protein J437_LFUL014002 [Ladona fulva]